MSRLLISGLSAAIKRFKPPHARFCRRDRMRVYLGNDVLAVCRISGRYRSKVVEKTAIRLPASGSNTADDLTNALAALSTWLEARSFNGTVEWIVGLDYVRYLMLPWDEHLSNDSFCDTLVKALLTQQLAEHDAGKFMIESRFAPLAYGYPRLAALIPQHIVHKLNTFSLRKRRLTTSITPALSLIWDHFVDRFTKGNGTIVFVEGPRQLRVAYDHGKIVALIVRPFSETEGRSTISDAEFMFPPTHGNVPDSRALLVKGMDSGDDKHIGYVLCGVL